MKQRDLLLDELEKMGDFITYLLNGFRALNPPNNQQVDFFNKKLENELDININELITMNVDALMKYLEARNLMHTQLLTLLSQYMVETGKCKEFTARTLYIQKAIDLLDIIDRHSNTFSFERNNLKNSLNKMLQQ